MNLILSRLQQNIISALLDAKSPLFSKELSEKTGVSTRSVKQNIGDINDLLAPYKLTILSNTHHGYWIEDKDAFFLWQKTYNFESPLPATQNQRIIYCLLHLLKYDGASPTLQKIADSLYVSKATISGVFKEIREIVDAASKVKMKSVKTGGFMLTGEELDIRHLFSSAVFLYYDVEREFLKRTAITCFLAQTTATPLHELLIRTFSENNIHLNDRDIMAFTLSLVFGAYRNMRGHDISGSGSDKSIPWLSGAERCLNVQFSPAERRYYEDLLNTLQSRESTVSNQKLDTENERILSEYHMRVLNRYGVFLSGYSELNQYLIRLITYDGFEGIAVPGPGFFHLSDHPFAYALALLFNEVLEEYGRPVLSGEDLMGLTAMISITLNGNAVKIRAIILTELRSGYQEYLSYRLMTHFSFYIDWIDTKPLYYIKRKKELDSIDLILCTSKNNLYSAYGKQMDSFTKEILYISSDLTQADLIAIEHYIHDYLPSRSGMHFQNTPTY